MTKKISVICTTHNEEVGICEFLESLAKQTKKPDEIVIVDSGSSDNTVRVIKELQKQDSGQARMTGKKANTTPLPITIIVEKCTRGKGRNLAIEEAMGEIIVVSDAGCSAHPDWLEKITKPVIAKKADVVAGFYHMQQPTWLSYYTAPYLGTMSHNLNKKTFLPSSRSLAFTKKVWKKVGGYPEEYKYAAEDLVFAQKLKDEKSVKWVVEPKAIVEWTPAHTVSTFLHDMSNHTKGNLEAGYTRHLKKNSLVAVRYSIGIPFFLGAVISLHPLFLAVSFMFLGIYFLYPSYKFRKLIRNPLDVIMFGVVQIIADIAVLYGLFTRI